MKTVSMLFLFVLFSSSTFGQEGTKKQPINGNDLKEKLDDGVVRAERKQKLKELRDIQAKYFRLPQGKWYFGAKTGYGVPFLTVNKRNVESYLGVSDYFESASGEITNKALVSNDAGGYKGAVYFGYRFNQFVSGEVDFSYNHYLNAIQGKIESPDYKSELYTRGKSISFNPQFVLYSPNMGNFTLFGKFGFFLPLWVDAKGTAKIDDYDGTFIKSIALGNNKDLLTLADEFAKLLGQNVEDLAYLEDGIFKAAGYHFRYSAETNMDFKIDKNVLGFSGSIGAIYQISPLIGILAEVKVGGYNISTKSYKLSNIKGTLDLNGKENYAVFTSDGVVVDGVKTVSADQLTWLTNVNYEYELDENSNNEITNPNGIDPTKAADRLVLRRSSMDASFNISLQFNFAGKKNK
ncbi:MAG: hypothetical protein KBF31_02625 [Chitinophagales bacterium]|nr:hypothetical protein [Chitinophagales bacterium]